jgi:NDP-sugar pyrophosphorylase family protein
VGGGTARLRGWRVREPFLDVGTPRDYLHAALRFAAVVPNAGLRSVGRSLVWPGCDVARGADLDECLVVGRVRVPSGFRGRSAVLAPAALVREDDRVAVRDGVAVFAF